MNATIKTPVTGNQVIDEFLQNYDFRISAADTKTPPAGKENLRRMRPAVMLLAVNEPAKCEVFIRNWIAKNLTK
jgi:hypothetical protein